MKKIIPILMFILAALLISSCAVGGWTDEDCHNAFNQLWWGFAHEESSSSSFKIPDFWSGTHGYFEFRSRSVDPDTLISGIEENCGHLYEFQYEGSSAFLAKKDTPGLGSVPEESYSWIKENFMLVFFGVIVFLILLLIGAVKNANNPRYA